MKAWDKLREVLLDASISEAEIFFRCHSFRAVRNRLETSNRAKTWALDSPRKKENEKKQQTWRRNFRKLFFLIPQKMTIGGPSRLSTVLRWTKLPPWAPLLSASSKKALCSQSRLRHRPHHIILICRSERSLHLCRHGIAKRFYTCVETLAKTLPKKSPQVITTFARNKRRPTST